MQKKKIINKKHIPSYSVCRKWGKIKVMMNEYIDVIYDDKLPEGVFAKKSKNGKIN